MRTWRLLGIALGVLAAGLPAAAQTAQAPCATCLVVSISPGQALALPTHLHGLELLIRVAAGEPTLPPSAQQAISGRGGVAGLHVLGIPQRPLPAEMLAGVGTLLFDLQNGGNDPAELTYTLKTRITEARAAAPARLRVGIAASVPTLQALLERDLAPYVDLIVWPAEPPADLRAPAIWRTAADPVPPLTDVSAALQQTAGAGSTWLWRAPEDIVDAARAISDLARAAEWLHAGLFASAGIDVRCGDSHAATFMDPDSLDTIALAYGCPAERGIEVRPPQTGVERVALSSGLTIVRVPAAATQDRFAQSVQVAAPRTLSVDEIVARHQTAAARQAALVRTLISTGTLTLTFEAPGFPAPVAISSEAILFIAPDRTEIEQRGIRVNGVAFRGGGVPKLPIIEPERAASPPLKITLTNLYRYSLVGRDTAGGVPCYVVAFEPLDAKQSLFRGRAWIAVDSFAMVKVAAAQTGLRGAVTSSEQVDEYRNEGRGVWLLARSEVRQIYEGAAYRTPIVRVLAIDRHDINPANFDARRAAAYASDSIMLRDTPQGYRYLRHDRTVAVQSGSQAAGRPGPAPVPAVAGRADRVRTLAVGVIVDPNITRPLPFAGISYVDFNLFGTGTQFSGFFGGTYGQLAFSVPSVRGTRWQLAGKGFGIASSYNDRQFVEGREQYDEDIRQRPASAALWLLRPLTPRLAVRLGYNLDYTRYRAGDATASDFRVPADQLVHAARVSLDGQRAGWNASLWISPSRRSGWRAWGRTGTSEYDPRQQDFVKYGASLARSVVVAPGLIVRGEAEWMAGHDLDRFSRYSFGTFDNRLRGYPSALIRYDRGGVLRGAIAWAAARLVRVDGFVDTAAVHDPGFGRGVRNYTGLGAAVEAPAPFGTLISIEWGYGIQGVNANGARGTQVVRVNAYKVF